MMSPQRPTPEQVICQMRCDELKELLSDLNMESTAEAAGRFQRLVRELGRLEDAIEALGGPASMKDAA